MLGPIKDKNGALDGFACDQVRILGHISGFVHLALMVDPLYCLESGMMRGLRIRSYLYRDREDSDDGTVVGH